MTTFANDNDQHPNGELIALLRYLDGTAIPLAAFGCYVAVSDDETTIFVCSMLADGAPEMDEHGHMNWSQVTAPGYEFVQQVNALFHTSFQVAAFARG